MDYKISLVASLVLFPKFLFQVFLMPWRVVSHLIEEDLKDWKDNYPDSEFLSILTITILTLATYSHISNGEAPERLAEYAAYLNITTDFGLASFASISIGLIITWVLSLLWLVLTVRKFTRSYAERAGRISFLIMLIYAIKSFAEALLVRAQKQDAAINLPESISPILDGMAWYCSALAFIYFFWTAFAYWKAQKLTDTNG